MEFRILGSLEVVGSAGPVDLRGTKRRGLLACLVVHAGRPMSTDRLVEELWGDSGSDGAVRTVQTYVSQLRKLLRGEAANLVTSPGGYVLEIDPATVDACRFEQGLTAASAETDSTRRLTLLDGALALWRGPPLDEFAGAGWADREATRLDARHLQALRRRYDTLLDLGRAGEAIAGLETLVRVHPLDEGFWAQLMLALYRSGRQADALAAYQQARRHLVDELGIEPGAELAQLEHRILDHDPALASPRSQAIVRARPAPARDGSGSWYPRTFLLTDIVDSVSLWERDPESMSQAVARHDTIIQDAVSASGGELVRVKGEGDSTFSVFAHPSDALAAAAAIHEAVAAEQWPSTTPLQVRTGVHTGDAEPRDGDWYGPAVNRAARLRALADGGETLLSGVTAGLVADQLPGAVRLLYRGRRVLRGIERPEEVWELVAVDDPRLAATRSARAGGLPGAQTRFVGRASDLDQLAQLVEAERLVTLTGPGGSGKTRLAMELARHAARRGEVVWLAELAALRDGELVAHAVAAAAGVETGPDPLDDLLAQSEALAGLLVLDNCEHLLDACAALVERVLADAPDIRILTTSREPLGLAGEQEWPVGPLDVPGPSLRDREQVAQVESVQLLLDRARAVRPGLVVSQDDVASVVSICRALDGIPLAIELAAGRLRSLSFAGLAERLDGELTVLTRHRSAGRYDARHQTLRMTLDWSYDLLTDPQRTLAQRLSVFAGGFRLDAVEAVCDSALDVLDGVDELVAKSMVTFDTTTARYRLLEPIRQYLAERLDETGETNAVQWAHAEWLASLCHRLGTRLLEDQKTRSLRLREEHGNVELALRWALDHREYAMAIRIVGSLGLYWSFYDQASGRRWCVVVLNAGVGVAPRLRARALLSAGMMDHNDQAGNRSIAWLREALAIYRAEELVAGQAASLFWLGRALSNWLNPEDSQGLAMEAMRCFEESLRLSIDVGDLVGAGWCRISLSSHALWDDDLGRAEELATQVIQECGSAGIRHPMGRALGNLAFISQRRGHDDAALELLEEAIALYRELDDPWELAGVLVDLAAVEAPMGRGAEALQALAESSRLDEQMGRLPGRSFRLAVAAVVHLARGQPAMATSALGAYDAHPVVAANWGRLGAGGGSIALLGDAVQSTRARLDPTEVAAATAAAHHRSVDELIDEQIIQPARVAGSPYSTIGTGEGR
jgi:predicted ATPase/DNA-binding SARP family transcriptional activator/class 3 adenylate cyclase